MADAFAADLASKLISKLVSLASEEVIQAWNLREHLDTLRERLELIDSLFSDADAKKITMSAVQIWFKKLETVANVADVFMDELAYNVTRRKVENRHKVLDFFIPSENKILYRFEVARKIKYINTSFEKTFKYALDIGLKPVENLSSAVQHKEIRNTPPFEDESQIVGRDNDILYLVQKVCQNHEKDLPVIGILGMGGQGKTTLARMVYNNDVVINKFPKRMWVTVSDDFDFIRILNELIVSLTSTPSVLDNPQGLITALQKNIKGEKFLLVLDDVWNEKPGEWEKLRDSLLAICAARGSNILVTTRKQEVIDVMRCSVRYQVEKLSDKDSWALFKQRAFSDGGVLETEAFTALGRSMVERCGGLPLAIKTLGGLLYSKKTEQEWLVIQNDNIWKSEGVLSSLRLSFDNLPYLSLKRCFAYCSIIPKDSRIYKDEMVQIWMALGFLLPPRDSNALMEDTGNDYFNILLRNSLLQAVEKDEYDNIICCEMHDLVHDLALAVSTNSATVKPSHGCNKVSKAIYVRLEGFKVVTPNIFKGQFDTVQALDVDASIFSVVLPNLNHLRVLILNSFCKELPSSIGNLKYLKYLDISSSLEDKSDYKLPNYITRLYNLQTLRVSASHELPEKVCNLINLRHLVVGNKDYWSGQYPQIRCMLIGIERLTCLQTLPHFIVSRDQNCLIGQLGGLNNLRGELEIYCLSEVKNKEEASKAKLCGKSNIQSLVLGWSNNEDEYTEDREDNNEDVMEGLEPRPNLKELKIDNFMGKKLASWITLMTNLVKVTLRNCNRCEGFPPLGHLPKLKKLKIVRADNVKVIGSNFCRGLDSGAKKLVTAMYPSLTKLILKDMPKLEEWIEAVMSAGSKDESIGIIFPKLEELEIENCPMLRKIGNSCFPSLKKLAIDNSSMKILETISRKVSSLTDLQLCEIGSTSSNSSSCSSNMDSIFDEFLKNNSMSLIDLYLTKCKGLRCLTLGVALKNILVMDCPDITSINVVKESVGIQVLAIERCPSLSNLIVVQCMSSTLVKLYLGPFSEESDEFPWPLSSSSEIFFPNLIWLALKGWEKVKSIQLIFGDYDYRPTFPSLTKLYIDDFGGVEALPDAIAKLPSLKVLYIYRCMNMGSLPTFDQSHNSLQSLDINGCPILKERCVKGSGPEWYKIQHIPQFFIDGKRFN